MKYLHIIPLGTSRSLISFSKTIVDILSSKDLKENNIVLINNRNATHGDLHKVQNYIQNKFNKEHKSVLSITKFISIAFNSNQIVFHELPSFKQRIIFGIILYILNRKVHWVVWGGDLYDINYFILTRSGNHNDKKSLKSVILKIINSFFVSRVSNIYSVRDDFDALSAVYKNKNFKFSELYYPAPIPKSKPLDLKYRKRVLISHSASFRNNHNEALEIVKSIDDGEIEVLAILSYGENSPDKIIEIINRGKNLFGNRFVPITKFLDQKSYWELLRTVKISISLTKRQSSIWTTAALLSLGVKVIMNKNTSPFKFYNENGLHVYDLNKELNNSNMLNINESSMIENSKIAKDLWSLESVGINFSNKFKS